MREILGVTPRLMVGIVVALGLAPVLSGGDEDEPDKPIEEIVVTAKRIKCPDGWTCSRSNPIGGDTTMLARVEVGQGLTRGNSGDEPPAEDAEREEDSTDNSIGCWKDLTSVPDARVSGEFNEKRASGPHKGIDLAVVTGTKVFAARAGVVVSIEERFADNDHSTKRGNYVAINYFDGESGRYLHLKHKSVFIEPNDPVSKGQLIALSNNTGSSQGAHLHYDHNTGDIPTKDDAWGDGEFVDPKKELGGADCDSQGHGDSGSAN